MRKEYKSYFELESDLSANGLSNVIYEITEMARTEVLHKPKTTENAQELILRWWQKQTEPQVYSHRLSYFCLWHLKKFCKVV